MTDPLNEGEKLRLAVICADPAFLKAMAIIASQRKVSLSSVEAAAIAHGYNEGKLAFASELQALIREAKPPSQHLRARKIKPNTF
jgi:hypothetical protein